MPGLILWCGFLGAWLLVAGPVYQASRELAEEEFERENFREAMESAGRPERISPWWWLMPPAHVVLSQRAKDEWWRQFRSLLSDEQYEQFHSYRSKSYGWLIVGLGGFLIATKETWELVEGNEWPTWLFWVLVVVALYVALGHAVIRNREDARVAEERRTARAGGSSSSGA